jgi:hypothetical protein
MLIGWMVVYILSYPVYSFFLPVYSFWCMDEFSWGNTRVVVGEGKEKKILMNEEEKFDESMIPLKKFSGTLSPFRVVDDCILIRGSFLRVRNGSLGYRKQQAL